jgi:glutamyl-tRNA synthetase
MEKEPNNKSKRTGTQGSFSNLDLPNAKEGEVCTRFPPEPSGYLHIGHAKAALLNAYYAETYKGKLIVRFDDTNPSKEKIEFVESILEDIQTLRIKPYKISYTSDYFPILLNYVEDLLKQGKAYVDNTTPEQMKKERFTGIESKCRNNSVEENIRKWEEMKKFSEEGRNCCVRIKIDMQSKNKCLRDPAIYRCNDVPHHRTGTQYKVYPLYDFACPIVDSIEGVTHALRSSEYHDRNALYNWILETLKLRKVHITDFSRLNFAYTVLSKRKLQKFVDTKIVSGWDDPRFPTIKGMLRRGLTVEALREFILSQGASKSITLMEPEKLWVINKKIIDPIVPRYTAIAKKDICPFIISDGPTEPIHKSIPRHKKNSSLGNKIITYINKIWLEQIDAQIIEQGEEITLMDWGNAIVEDIQKDESGNIKELHGHLHLEGSFKTTKKKLTWLPIIDDVIPIQLVQFDHLITKKKN